MKHIIVYLKMHWKYKMLYLLTIPLMSISFGISITIILASAFTSNKIALAELFGNILFGIISSSPLIIPNYKASIYCEDISCFRQKLMLVIGQSISIGVYCMLFRVYAHISSQ